jgi:glycosyltransferase involved in cell wall biosynthesis
MKDLAILVPAYNEESTIIRCLESLLEQEDVDSIDWNICVIANNCSDNTVLVVNDFIKGNSLEDRVLLVETDTPGKSKALNLGMKSIMAKKYAVIDADSSLEKSSLMKIYKKCKNKNLKIVGALDRPIFKNKKSLLYEYQMAQQIYREERGRVLPVGRFYMFDSDTINEFPDFLHSEDTWIDLEIAKNYGWEAVLVLMNAIVYFTPANNWLDFIKQESRFECGLPQIIHHYPELETVWEKRREGEGRSKDRKTVFQNIKKRLTQLNIKPERIDEFDTLILDIIEDNATLMSDQLISEDGLWEPINSTKV